MISAAVKGARVSKSKNAATPKIKAELLQEEYILSEAALNGTCSEEVEDEI